MLKKQFILHLQAETEDDKEDFSGLKKWFFGRLRLQAIRHRQRTNPSSESVKMINYPNFADKHK